MQRPEQAKHGHEPGYKTIIQPGYWWFNTEQQPSTDLKAKFDADYDYRKRKTKLLDDAATQFAELVRQRNMTVDDLRKATGLTRDDVRGVMRRLTKTKDFVMYTVPYGGAVRTFYSYRGKQV